MATLDTILEYYAPLKRAGLLPALQAAQEFEGWLSRETVKKVAQTLGVPLAEAYGVVKFYSMLYTEPVGHRFVRVCDDVLCQLAGAQKVLAEVEVQLGVECGKT